MHAKAWAVLAITTTVSGLGACSDRRGLERITAAPALSMPATEELDAELRGYLASLGYTGRVASTLELRIGVRDKG